MNKFYIPLLLMVFLGLSVQAAVVHQDEYPKHDANKMIIPIGGNTWTINGGKISNEGLTNWNSTSIKVKVYVYISQSGSLNLSLNMNPGGKNRIKVTIQDVSKEVTVEGSFDKEFYVGKWENVQRGM